MILTQKCVKYHLLMTPSCAFAGDAGVAKKMSIIFVPSDVF